MLNFSVLRCAEDCVYRAEKGHFHSSDLAHICLNENVSQLCSHGCLFYMAHTAQFGAMLAAVIVAP
jgi:hypothetical protein